MAWLDFVTRLREYLNALEVSSPPSRKFGAEEGFALWWNWARRARKEGGTIFFIGNGANATLASHCAGEVMKNGGIRTQVFSDISLVTAVSNEVSFEEVFSYPLKRYGQMGDMLVAISSTGNSPNIRKAVETARDKSIQSVTLTGMAKDNPLRGMGDLNFYLPGRTAGEVETAHAAILHYWMDSLSAEYGSAKPLEWL